jgi:hypothetical protein
MRHVKKFLNFINEKHWDDVKVNLDDLKKQDNIVFVKQKEGYEMRRKGQFDRATLVVEIKNVKQVGSPLSARWDIECENIYCIFDNHYDEPTVKEIQMGGMTLRVTLSGDNPEIISVGSQVVRYEPVDEEESEKIFKMCQENDSEGMMDKISKYDVGDLEGMGSMSESKMYRRKYRR